MSEWISVYCRHPIELDADAMRREIESADLWTLAESLDLSSLNIMVGVESLRLHLRIEAVGSSINVHWKPAGRPIHVTTLLGPAAAAEAAETMSEFVADATVAGSLRVRECLRSCEQIVHFEMGGADAQHLGAPLGEVLAFSVAEAGDGLVWFFGREWASPADRGTTIWGIQ